MTTLTDAPPKPGRAYARTEHADDPPVFSDDGLAGMDAADLLLEDLPPLRQAFVGLLPEGLGIIGAPPKAGKSLLAYQMAVHLVSGLDLLGCAGERRPVRYYALEDGKRRSQDRVRNVLQGRRLPRGLRLDWTAPSLGGPLEQEIDDYLTESPEAVVIIDVLSKVRPAGGKTTLNAYDADYQLIQQLHNVVRRRPGSTVLLVTHDRKAGSEDWMSRLTGTRGVTGVADFVIFLNRKRSEDYGQIHVTGRDIEDKTFDVLFRGNGWQLADATLLIGQASPARQTIFNFVMENGPVWQKAIIEGTGLDADVVYHRVRDMANDGQLIGDKDGYRVPANEEP